MIPFVAFVVAISALVAFLLHRDIRRAVRRRALRRRLLPIARSFSAFQAAVGTALLPTMVRAAADMERSMRQVQETMGSDGMERLRALADGMRKP